MIDKQTLEIIEPNMPAPARSFGEITGRSDGTYVIDGYHVCPKSVDPYGKYDIEEVEAYLLDHPEALIPEPIPPAPTQEELDAREVQTAKSYLSSTDWIVAKIGEAQMKGGDISPLLGKYAPDLAKREEARATINELEVA